MILHCEQFILVRNELKASVKGCFKEGHFIRRWPLELALLVGNALMTGGNHSKYKLDELPLGVADVAFSAILAKIIAKGSIIPAPSIFRFLSIVAISAHKLLIIDLSNRIDLKLFSIHLSANDYVLEFHFVAG